MTAEEVGSDQSALSEIPSVDQVLSLPSVNAVLKECPRPLVTDLIRTSLDRIRRGLLDGERCGVSRESLLEEAEQAVLAGAERKLRPNLRQVINATGIILHTGLGRAPIGQDALRNLMEVSESYCNLELDLETGRRGVRHAHVEELLCDFTGAEAATAVNNNAGAVLLVLKALAQGREAIVSRGQLVEIGGSFRIPDIMAQSGAYMMEVGTTNRTHLSDYRNAIREETALLLSVHTSNYRVVGFSAEVELKDLATLGAELGVPVMHDLGSGAFVDLRKYGLPYEPVAEHSIRDGADVVTFSGDKVLGGPQAGIIVGKKRYLDEIRRHPLMRALRCGKLTYAALEATLRMYLNEDTLLDRHPLLGMFTEPVDRLVDRGRRLICMVGPALAGVVELVLEDSIARTGGGALPIEEIPSVAVVLKPLSGSIEQLAERMRAGEPSVLGYVKDDRLFLDMRTVREEELEQLASAIQKAIHSPL